MGVCATGEGLCLCHHVEGGCVCATMLKVGVFVPRMLKVGVFVPPC